MLLTQEGAAFSGATVGISRDTHGQLCPITTQTKHTHTLDGSPARHSRRTPLIHAFTEGYLRRTTLPFCSLTVIESADGWRILPFIFIFMFKQHDCMSNTLLPTDTETLQMFKCIYRQQV